MNILLVVALAAVYLVGIAGVVLSSKILGPQTDVPGGLEERLAVVRDDSRSMPSHRNRAS